MRQDEEGWRQPAVLRSLPRLEQELGRVGQREQDPEDHPRKSGEEGKVVGLRLFDFRLLLVLSAIDNVFKVVRVNLLMSPGQL